MRSVVGIQMSAQVRPQTKKNYFKQGVALTGHNTTGPLRAVAW